MQALATIGLAEPNENGWIVLRNFLQILKAMQHLRGYVRIQLFGGWNGFMFKFDSDHRLHRSFKVPGPHRRFAD